MRPSIFSIFLLIIIIGIVGGIARYGYQFFTGERGYVAVVLTTGDVYFGKAETTGGEYLTLTRTYYPQTFKNDAGADELRLVKVGTEFYAPQDRMRISHDQIVVIQPLEESSPILTSMDEYEVGQK